MRNAPKPISGQEVKPYVGNQKIWNRIVLMLADYSAGKFKNRRSGEIIAVPSIENITEDQLEVGTMNQLGDVFEPDAAVDEDLKMIFYNQPKFESTDPVVWPDVLKSPVLLNIAVNPESTGMVRSARYVVVDVTIVKEEDKYVMPDPADPTKLKTADAGLYRIVGIWPEDNKALVDTQESQPMWRFEATGSYSGTPPVSQAKLLRLDGDEYAGTGNEVEVVDYLETGQTQGFCTQIGDRFVVAGGGGGGDDTIYAEVGNRSGTVYDLVPKISSKGPSTVLPIPFKMDLANIPTYARPTEANLTNGINKGDKDWIIITGKPGDQTPAVPPAQNDPGQWIWTGTTKWIAKWIEASVTIPAMTPFGNYQITGYVNEYWDGYSPGGTVPVDFPVVAATANCSQSKTVACYATWMPEYKRYKAISTQSAFMGNGQEITVATSNMTYGGTGGTGSADGGKACYESDHKTVTVFGCDDPPFKQNQLCIDPDEWSDKFKEKLCKIIKENCDLCDWICQNCDQFAVDDGCLPPCKGDCVWLWSSIDQDWNLDASNSTECTNQGGCGCENKPTEPPADPNNPGSDWTVTLPCSELPPPECGNCEPCGGDLEGQIGHFIMTARGAMPSNTGSPGAEVSWNFPAGNLGLDNQSQQLLGLECGDGWKVAAQWNPAMLVGGGLSDYYQTCVTIKYNPADAGSGTWSMQTGKSGPNGENFYLELAGDCNLGVSDPGPTNGDVTASNRNCTTFVPIGCEDGSEIVTPPGTMSQAFQSDVFDQAFPEIPVTMVHDQLANLPQLMTVEEAINATNDIGKRLIVIQPSLFAGCSCKKDVLAVMARWTPGEVTEEQIERVAATLASKVKKFSKGQIVDMIKSVAV